jgi:hypothetical protein
MKPVTNNACISLEKRMHLITHWRSCVVLLSLLLAMTHSVHASSSAVLDAELNSIKQEVAGELPQVLTAIDRLEWSGISDTDVFDILAARLETNYSNNGTAAQELNAWLAKALSLSGQEKYEILLNNILASKTSKKLRRHVEIAGERLRQHKRWNPIIAKNNHLANTQQELVEMRTLNMLRSTNYELATAGARLVHNRYRDNAVLMAEVQKILAAEYRSSRHPAHLDTMAWMCRALGESGDSQYKALLTQIANDKATHKKIKRYAKKYALAF